MIIVPVANTLQPRHRVWCRYTELVQDAKSKIAYRFADQSISPKLGDGSEILVIDKPGMILFFSQQMQKAFAWANPPSSILKKKKQA